MTNHSAADGRTTDNSLVSLVAEAIDQFATPGTRDSIIKRACDDALVARLPRTSSELWLFFHNYMMDELRRVLGDNVADAILDEVELVLERTSQVGAEFLPPASRATEPDARGASTVDRASGVQPRIRKVVVAIAVSQLREQVVEMVESAGWRAIEVCDGVTALAMCSRHHPPVVICDLALPKVDGPTLAQLLALALGGRTPRIVLLTGDRRSPHTFPFIDTVLYRPLQPDEIIAELMLPGETAHVRATG